MKKELSYYRDGKRIYGRLYLPDGLSETGAKPPTVILSHGFNSDISGIGDFARELAGEGCIAYAYEFIGGGLNVQSDGKTTEMSVLTEAEDLKCVMDGITALPEVDPDNLFLMGESQGGFVSTYAATEYPERVRGLIALFPAYVLQDDARARVRRSDTIPDFEEVMGVPLGRIYTEDAGSFDIYDRMPKYQKPVLIMHGTADTLVPIRYSERAVETFPHAELVKIPGAVHGFAGKDREIALKEMIRFIRKYEKN